MIEDLIDPADPEAPNGGFYFGLALALLLEAVAFAIGYFGRLAIVAAESWR